MSEQAYTWKAHDRLASSRDLGAGPLAELGVAVLLVSLSPAGVTGVISSPTGLVGAAMVVNAVFGLLIPVSRNSDAAKIYRGLASTGVVAVALFIT